MALVPNDKRRAALSAGLLASNHDGEVLAAARALCMLLRKGNLDPASVVSAGLSAIASPAVTSGLGTDLSGLRERARAASHSTILNDWERGFLADVRHRRKLTPRQEGMLRSILSKAERKAA